MSNRERLEDAGILLPPSEAGPYTPEELETLESLTEEEIYQIIVEGRHINEVAAEHQPSIMHIGFHALPD